MIKRNPFLIPLIGLVAGIILLNLDAPIWTAAILTVAAGIVFMIIRQSSKNPVKAYYLGRYHYLWSVLLFCSVGLFTAYIHRPVPPDLDSIKNIKAFKGSIKSISYRNSGDRLIVNLEGYFTTDSLYHAIPDNNVLLYSDGTSLQPGDIIIIPSDLRHVTNPENYYMPDYKDNMHKRGIFYTLTAKDYQIKKTGHRNGIHIIALKCRDNIIKAIEKTGFNNDLRNFLITILTGDRDYLDTDLRSRFSDAGISHILALSGMHIAIIASFFLFLLYPVNFTGRYKLRTLGVIILIWMYTLISGFLPSTVRAAIMFSFAGCAMLLERKNSSFNALCFAAFAILLLDPNALTDIGFQLSFVCVASLICFAQYFNRVDKRHHPRLHKLNGIIIATLTATCTSWVLTAYYFGTVPTLFLPANLIALPLLPLFLALAILSIIASAIGVHLTLLNTFLNAAFHGFTDLIESLSDFDGGSAIHFSPSIFTVILWLGGVALLGWYIHTNSKKGKPILYAGSGMIAASLCIMILMPAQSDVEGFIVQNRFDTISILEYKSGNSKLHQPPVKSLSHLIVNNRSIITADCNADSIVKNKSCLTALPKKCDYIIISKGFSGNISTLIDILDPEMVIIHPSIFRKREEAIVEECMRNSIKTYRIRQTGAYREF